MRIVKQKLHLPINNHDLHSLFEDNHSGERKKHGELLPLSIRAIICGPSNCGKTNVLVSLLFEPNGLCFENVYIYSKSLHQPKYRLLKHVVQKIKGMKYHSYRENEDVLDPAEADKNSVFIFDDVACEKQDKIRLYFSMGRHSSTDCFYLCQSYTRIPKHLIRDNANVIVAFKQDDINLKHIYDEHVNTDMTLEMFKSLCWQCWKKKFGCLVIVKDDDINNGRYRFGFDKFIITQ